MRLTFLKLLLIIAGLVYLSTEFLSFFNVLTPAFLLFFWLFAASLAGYWIWKNKTNSIQWRDTTGHLSGSYQLLGLLSVVVVVLPLLFLAIYAPPNNVDANNYHLTRVVLWLQNHNVNHFPTIHVQQLYHNVMSEYLLLHVLALCDNDYFVNVIQWGAMLGTVAGVGLIAKQLGLSLEMQLLVSILQLTLPIGILEATSTQNDYVATFFLISFIYFGIRLLQDFRWSNVWWMSLSLALGGFTKYPVFFYALPYCLWIGVQVLRKKGLMTAVSTFGVALATLVVVFAPFFYRNYALFDSILSPKPGDPLFLENIAAEQYCFTCTVSNTAKNIGLHLGLPSAGYNAKIDALMLAFHNWIGMDINNPKLSLDTYRTQFVIQEDMSGNLLLLILLMIAGVWLLFQRNYSLYKGILACALIGFIIFCSAAKFQLWSSRTHMPLFAQGTVIGGLFLKNLPGKWRIGICYFFLITALPYVVDNFNKPLFPIRYASKYLLGYIPRHLCIPHGADAGSYRKVLNKEYNFSKPEPCYPLIKEVPYFERQEMVGKLAALGYYQFESEHVFKHKREQYFFICDNDYPHTYHDFRALAKYIPADTRGIGMLWDKSQGFYKYWSSLRDKLGSDLEMNYILFAKDYLTLPNARRIFAYNYILCDNTKLIGKYLPKEQIETIYRTPSLALIKLKKPSTQYYHP